MSTNKVERYFKCWFDAFTCEACVPYLLSQLFTSTLYVLLKCILKWMCHIVTTTLLVRCNKAMYMASLLIYYSIQHFVYYKSHSDHNFACYMNIYIVTQAIVVPPVSTV